YDAAGNQILNNLGTLSSGGPDPIEGVTTQIYDRQIEINFTTNLVDWSGIDRCWGQGAFADDNDDRPRVNSVDISMTINGQVRVFPAGTLLADNYAIGTTVDGPTGIAYHDVTYILKHRGRGWIRE